MHTSGRGTGIPADFYHDVASGGVPGHSVFARFGSNAAVGTTYEDVWTVSANRVELTSPSTFTVTSNSAQDDIAGTGMQKILVVYLDGNFNQVQEELSLVGSGTVATSGTGLRVIRAYGTQWGSGKENAAIVGITATTGGTAQGQIALGENQTLMTHYTIPAGYTGYLNNVWAGVGKGDECLVKLVKKDATVADAGYTLVTRFRLYEIALPRTYSVPLIIPEKTDLVVKAQGAVGTIAVDAGYDLILVADGF